MALSLSELSALENTLAEHLCDAEQTATRTVASGTADARQEAHTLLEEPGQPDALERLDRLRLFQKLLTNLRLNQDLFADSALDLRVNQLRAVEALARFLAREGDGHRTGYFRQPSGAGKTVLFGMIARLLSVRTLVLVPRTNLVSQTVQELTEVVGFPSSDIGRVGAGRLELQRPVTVATYQSHLSRMESDAKYREWVGDCELVICDEAHRSLGTRTAESIDALDVDYSDGEFDDQLTENEEADEEVVIASLTQEKTKALKLGFTATPRLASKSVEERFGTCIASETHADLVAAKILVPYRLVSVDGRVTDLDLEGTFTEEKEAAVLHRNRTYQTLATGYATVLRAFREKTGETPYPMRGVAFCVTIAECDAFVTEAEAVGLRARVVTGREAKGSRSDDVIREAEQQLMSGEIDLIVTVAKLGEGWDFPPANAVIWARASMSEAVVIQGIGRTARTHFDEATAMRKPFSYVFETRWSLESDSGRRRRRRPLSIADALVRNGEDPTLICQNADASPLVYERPITREEVSTLIQQQYTPDIWTTLTQPNRRGANFAGTGLGITAIARIFDIEGDPLNKNAVLHALGRAIWPDTYSEPEAPDRERVRTLITAAYTPDTWAKLRQANRKGRNFAGTGLGLQSIATLFDIEGDPVSSTPIHHALGRAIWPDTYGDPEAKERERVRTLLQQAFTPDTWARLTAVNRKGRNFAGTGLGLTAIARLFGIEGNPINTNAVLHALGWAIFGETYGDPEAKERERARTLLQQQYTPDTWTRLTKANRECSDDNFAGTGLGLTAIARLFAIEGSPISTNTVLHALGRAIWPDTYGDPEAKERERVRTLITAAYTPDTWAKLRQANRKGRNFAGTGLGINSIATLFGIDGNALTYPVHYALGRAIWPDTYGDPEAKERERVRTLLQQQYTPDTWTRLTKANRKGRNFAGTGLGINAIGSLFGIDGDPIGNNSALHALGRAIWRDQWVELA